MINEEIIILKRILGQKQKEYFFLFRLHKFARMFFDHDEGIRMLRFMVFLAANILLYFLVQTLKLSAYEWIAKIILTASSIYAFFVFVLYYKHKHLAYEMHQIESHISEIEHLSMSEHKFSNIITRNYATKRKKNNKKEVECHRYWRKKRNMNLNSFS